MFTTFIALAFLLLLLIPTTPAMGAVLIALALLYLHPIPTTLILLALCGLWLAVSTGPVASAIKTFLLTWRSRK